MKANTQKWGDGSTAGKISSSFCGHGLVSLWGRGGSESLDPRARATHRQASELSQLWLPPEGDGEPPEGFRQSYQGDGDRQSCQGDIHSRVRVTDTVVSG